MNIKNIRLHQWYETAQGIGECLAVGGTRPPSVKFRIMHPIPRGILFLNPREIIRECQRPPMSQAANEI